MSPEQLAYWLVGLITGIRAGPTSSIAWAMRDDEEGGWWL